MCKSPDGELALWYSQATVVAAGERIGERVAAHAADAYRLDVPCGRRPEAHQTPSLQKQTRCLVASGFTKICVVGFHVMSAAVDQFATREENRASTEYAEEPEGDGAEREEQRRLISTIVAWQLMLMRIHKNDPR